MQGILNLNGVKAIWRDVRRYVTKGGGNLSNGKKRDVERELDVLRTSNSVSITCNEDTIGT